MEVPPQKKRPWFWSWSIAAVIFRLVLVYFPSSLNLSSRPEVSTPVTSLRRRLEVITIIFCADFVTALLIRATGQNLQVAYGRSLELLGLSRVSENSGLVPLAAFGWVIASHLSLYPAVIVIPVVLLLGYGPDAPPRKYLLRRNDANFGDNLSSDSSSEHRGLKTPAVKPANFLWRPVVLFLSWASVWALYVLVLCWMSVKEYGGLWEMFKRTYGFIITVQDLSPNIDIQFSFFLFCGYVGVSLLSPVMHNLWIWRGTGNANFYFATAMAYACFQIVLVVECVTAMLNHDRMIRTKLSTAKA
ncbi:hypothetical protein RJ640_018830 [Escallonia rubra]|uniref:GPI transamidase subunit PIG-U n=1 Tax=Escallonia rubra TaxID=112253 RepID=A0AA88UNY4_9ASTE|nr:hypothetical protein RJ640_018830 [Escallonia rubra]